MDELQKLYDVLAREGKYTKSFEEFKTQWGDQSYKDKVFEIVSRDGLYTKDKNSFFQKYSTSAVVTPTQEPVAEKKNELPSTTESPSADGSSALPKPQPLSQPIKMGAAPQDLPQGQGQPFAFKPVAPTPGVAAVPLKEEPKEEDGIVKKVTGAIVKSDAALLGLASKGWQWFLEKSDDIVNAEKNMLKQGGFFDEDMPETDTPISDALKKQIEKGRKDDSSPLDPRVIISGIATIANKIINSALPQEQRNAIINRLAIASNNIQGDVKNVESFQKDVLPDNVPVNIAKNIIGMAPELILAASTGNPAITDSKIVEWTKKSTEKAAPIIQKYAPKAVKVVEESIVAPFTKIMATEEALRGAATAKEGENPFVKAVNGAIEGTVAGMEMHGLGEVAGKVTPVIAKGISKLGLNSAIASAIASPLANAGVFTSAKALRVAATEQRPLTMEEIEMEAGTGVGFSLLHLGSQYKNQKEANHFYDNVLKDNAAYSLGRVVNETKENLDIVYNPDLTPEKITELKDARDELKKAILKEPDLQVKQTLGSEALKIQNQLDANSTINSIIESKDALIDEINDNDKLTIEQKKFYSNKIAAIAETYDRSEFAVKKRELNAKIDEAQKNLDKSGEVFTNLKSPSDRIQAKIDIDKKRQELEDLNGQLTELITNKTKEQDAIQKQRADESLLRAGEERLGLQQVGEGNTKPEVITEQETITPEGTQEIGEYEYEGKKYIIDKDGIVTDIERDSMVPADLADRVKSDGKLIESAPEGTQEVEKPTEDQILQDIKDGNLVTFTYKNESEVPEVFKDKISSRGETNGEPIIRVTVAKSLADYELSKQQPAPKEKPVTPESKSLADKIRAAKVGKGKAFDAILGIPVAIWDGSVELIAKTVEAGKSLGDAIKAGKRYIEANYKGKFDAKEYEREIKAGFISGYKESMQGLQEDVDFASRRKKLWEDRIVELNASHEKYKESDKYKKGDPKDTEYKRKIEEAKAERNTEQGNIDNAIDKLKDSDVYKNANSIEQEELVRDVRERFDIKEKKAPSPEKLLGQKNSQEIKMTIKKYMTEVSKAAKEGAKSVKDRITEAKKQIQDYFESVKEYGNLRRKDLNKIRKEMMKVEDEKSLDKAVDKINDIIDKAKTDVLEISELKMIKDKLKGIKEAKGDLNEKRKVMAAAIDFIEKSGKISSKQAGVLLKKINKVNLEKDSQIEKVIEYAEKVFEDAEYSDKLAKANDFKKSLSKLSKSEEKNIHLRKLAEAFAEIKPSMVDDIDTYNEMAAKIKESLMGSKTTVSKEDIVKFADMVNIDKMNEYIDDVIDAQRTKLYEEKLAEVQEEMGIDGSDMTYEELVDLMNSTEAKDEKKQKEKETIIRDTAKKMFDTYTSIIKHIFETGKDPFTDEDIEISKSKREAVTKFMGMDLDLLSAKQNLEAVDSLSNFLQNGSTAKMDRVVSEYKGIQQSIEAVKEHIVAKELKLYKNSKIGRLFAEQLTTMPVLFERMFKGERAGAKFSKISGFTELMNKKTLVQTMSNTLVNSYTKEFYNKKANGKDFDSQLNIVERGIIADLKRSAAGSDEQIQAEFDKGKGIIEQSIDALKKGNENEQALAKIYKEAYDKVLKDSKNIDDVISKSDKINVEAVNWWTDRWSNIYDQLADVSENIYNEILDKDLNYNPRKFSNLSERGETPSLVDSDASLFHGNNNGVYKKKTGVLHKAERDANLPTNSKDQPRMFRDLSFDKNMSNSMYDALMDIHTSGVVRQIESFYKSKDIDKIIPFDADRALLFNDKGSGRIQEYVRNIRNKQIVNADEMTKLAKSINRIGSIGASAALGGISQPLKQVIPVAMNTLINTNGRLEVSSLFSKNQNAFLDRIGYGISTRGQESQTNIQSVNKIMDLAARSTPKKAAELIEKANKWWLNTFLVRPDVYIARASWIAYYEKALKKQGINPKSIVYKDHEVNKDAADYAQRMVDRQQNVSDSDLQGKFFSSKDPVKQIISKVAMPFANFRLNQTMRMMSDISTLTAGTNSSKEDKATARKSLAGFAVEMAVFKLVSGLAVYGIGYATNKVMGKDESDEEQQKRKEQAIKGQATSMVTDVLSPLPMLDIFVAKGADAVWDKVQGALGKEEGEKTHLYTDAKTDAIKQLGSLGIVAGRAKDLYDIIDLSTNGEFKDDYGRTKYIPEDDRDALKNIAVLSLLSNFGLAPSEVNNIAKNAIRTAKRNAITESTSDGKKKEELQGYDNKSEMKRYDPDLYEETFGKGSADYESDQEEKKLKSEEKKAEREAEDEEYGYTPKK